MAILRILSREFFFLPPLQLQDRQTTAKWENANCKLAVLQVFPASLLSHHYLLTPDFLVSVCCLLIEYTKILGTITTVTDKQQPCSWLEQFQGSVSQAFPN